MLTTCPVLFIPPETRHHAAQASSSKHKYFLSSQCLPLPLFFWYTYLDSSLGAQEFCGNSQTSCIAQRGEGWLQFAFGCADIVIFDGNRYKAFFIRCSRSRAWGWRRVSKPLGSLECCLTSGLIMTDYPYPSLNTTSRRRRSRGLDAVASFTLL